MTNKKMIRYTIASEKIREVAQRERWGVGSGMLYQLELADNMRDYARKRSGYDIDGGCITGCLASLIGALGGAAFGAIYFGNGDETGLLTKTLYKVGGGIGGFISGGILAFLPILAKSYYDSKIIENISKERRKRREKRGINGISEWQRRSVHIGLIEAEFNRFDVMTGRKYSKLMKTTIELSRELENRLKAGENKDEVMEEINQRFKEKFPK